MRQLVVEKVEKAELKSRLGMLELQKQIDELKADKKNGNEDEVGRLEKLEASLSGLVGDLRSEFHNAVGVFLSQIK